MCMPVYLLARTTVDGPIDAQHSLLPVNYVDRNSGKEAWAWLHCQSRTLFTFNLNTEYDVLERNMAVHIIVLLHFYCLFEELHL
jgi:hypothetical protein